MPIYMIWAVAGLALMISEVLTGTFYLLVLGIAALVGAGAAFSGFDFWTQAVVASVVAVAGVLWVQQRRRLMVPKAMPSPDVGQPVNWEGWVNEPDRSARVRYRGASWEARVRGECAGQAGEVLYIIAVDGNTLEVAKTRSA
ncbi:MAG: hypothetical protein C5B46_00545 [Proteobacteria bacterium]|nr:MAG: hypothetical protein C5B46_00545 [Pseudomonadota bacterium]